MKKILFFILYIALISNVLYGQNIAISGTILAKNTGQPIDFASISVVDFEHIGTISNERGNFKLTLEALPSTSNQLAVSCLGFVSDTISIEEIDSLLIINLLPATTSLNEIEIYAPKFNYHFSIIENSLNKHPKKRHLLTGVYREIIYNDSIPLLFCEAEVSIIDPGIKKDFSTREVFIHSLRKTSDFRGLDSTQMKVEEFQSLNGLHILLDKNYVRNYTIKKPSPTNPFMSDSVYDMFDFIFDGLLKKEENYYYKFFLNPKIYNSRFDNDSFILVDRYSGAIVSMNIERKIRASYLDDKQIASNFLNSILPNGFFSPRTIIKYSEINNLWSPCYLSSYSTYNFEFNNNNNHSKFYIFKELTILQTTSDNQEIKSKTRNAVKLNYKKNMYNQDVNFVPLDWQSSNLRINPDLNALLQN